MKARKSTEFEIITQTKSKKVHFGLASLYYNERRQELTAVTELKEKAERTSWCNFNFCRKFKSVPDQIFLACIEGRIELPAGVNKHELNRKIVFAKNQEDIDTVHRGLRNDICLYKDNKKYEHPKVALTSLRDQTTEVECTPIRREIITGINFIILDKSPPKPKPGESAPAMIMEKHTKVLKPLDLVFNWSDDISEFKITDDQYNSNSFKSF